MMKPVANPVDVFIGLSRIASEEMSSGGGKAVIDWEFAGFCMVMLVISALAILITQHPAGRRWYVVTTVGQAGAVGLAIDNLIDLSPWQQVELLTVTIGLILLGIGHYGWYKEQDQQSDLVSMSLLSGSIWRACRWRLRRGSIAVTTCFIRSMNSDSCLSASHCWRPVFCLS